MPHLEVFTGKYTDRGRTRRATPPSVTICADGRRIGVSRSAYEALGKPAAVELLFDATETVVGFRSVARGAPNSFVVLVSGRVAHYVICHTFLRHVGFGEPGVVRRFPAEMDGDVLVARIGDAGADHAVAR